MEQGDRKPTECVGVICFRGDDVLLIRRANPPRAGEWSLPGGRIDAGESERDAAVRELMEETAVEATLGEKIAIIDANFEGFDYRLHDFTAEWVSGDPIAADDALDARFFPVGDIGVLQMWSKTEQVIWEAHSAVRTRSVKKDKLG